MPGQPCCSGFFFACRIFESGQPEHSQGQERHMFLERHQKSGARGRI